MNAVIDPNASNGAAGVARALPPRRLYAGQGYPGEGEPQGAAADYTMLVPTDDAWSHDTLMRATVADALQRNGKVVDEDTLEATVAAASAPGGVLADADPAWKLQPGQTRADGRASPPFLGYAIELPATTQRTLVEQASDIATRQQAAGPVPVDGALAELRSLAAGNGANDVLQTLAALEAAIKAGQVANAEGQRVDAVAVRAMVEFATRMGKEREAARIMERYTALKGVEGDVKDVGQDITRVISGRDPLTGRPLNTDQRVEAAFGLVSNGFKLVGDLGAAAQLLGVGGRFASTLIGIAPAGIAIVGFAAGVYGLIKKVREAINEPQWDEFRARFPLAEDMEPKQFLKAAMRQIAGMPTDGDNGLSTASRVLEILGQNPETRERFLGFLRQKGQSEELLDALAAGKFDGIGKEQAAELARASKGFAREFLEHEIDDTRRYVKDRDGDRTRGTYLLEGQARSDAERNTNKVGGTVDEVLRIGGILVGSADQVVGSFQALLGQLRGGVQVDGKALDAQQQRNLAAATAAAAAGAGLGRVDHLLPSNDGRKLFAIQGNPQSEARRMVAVDIATGVAQSVESSNRQREAALPAMPVQSASQQEQVLRGM